MKDKKELINWMKLCSVKGMGPKKIMKLFSLFQSLSRIMEASKDDLLRSRLLSEVMVDELFHIKENSNEHFERIIDLAYQENIIIMPMYDVDYPLELKIISSPPLNLFLQGDISLLKTRKVAIVGSRSSDEKSKIWAFENAKLLAEEKITIVSGGAIGIDIEAHKGSLSVNGNTICVLGSGILKPYPDSHRSYFEIIKKKGLLISENEPMAIVSPLGLLRRNRIISAISDAMIVVTSEGGGGTMTQLDHAFDQRIPLFSPPQKLNFQPSEGLDIRREEFLIKELNSTKQITELVRDKRPSFYLTQKTLSDIK